MPDLVPVHGGLEAPVSRTVPLSRRKQFLAEAAALPRIEMSRADLATVYRIADGTLSPLTGPMDEETWHHVLDTTRSNYGFRTYAWTAPIAFPITDDEAKQLRVGQSARDRLRGQHRRHAAGVEHLRLGQGQARRAVLRHHAHRSSGRAHDHGRPAHASWSAASCGRCRSRSIRTTAQFMLSARARRAR